MSLPLVHLYSQKAKAVKENWEKEASRLLFSLQLMFFKHNICMDILQTKTAPNLRKGGIIFTKKCSVCDAMETVENQETLFSS